MEIQRHRCKKIAIAFCCILLVLLLLVSDSHSTQEDQEEEERLRNNKNPSNWKLLRLSTYWEAIIKFKLLAMTPFYPLSFLPSSKPSTDFRGKVEKEEGGAVEKSIEKAKETIEESAKSAANVAKEKLKNTISHKNHPQDEL